MGEAPYKIGIIQTNGIKAHIPLHRKWSHGEFSKSEFNAFFTTFLNTKKKTTAKAYTFAKYEDDIKTPANLREITALVYDFDHKDVGTYDEVYKLLEATHAYAVMYTSWSHMVDGQEHFRVILPLRERYTKKLHYSHWVQMHAAIAEIYKLPTYDSTSAQPNRAHFGPCIPAGRDDYVPRADILGKIPLTLVGVQPKKIPLDDDAYFIRSQEPVVLDVDGRQVDIVAWWKNHNQADLADIVAKKAPGKINKSRRRGGYYITCPNHENHTNGKSGKTDCFVDSPGPGHDTAQVYCQHAHCQEKSVPWFIKKMIEEDWFTLGDITDDADTIINNKIFEQHYQDVHGTQSPAAAASEEEIERQLQDEYRKQSQEEEKLTPTDEIVTYTDDSVDLVYDIGVYNQISNDTALAHQIRAAADVQTAFDIIGEAEDELSLYKWALTSVPYDELPFQKETILLLRYNIKGLQREIDRILSEYAAEYEISEQIHVVATLFNISEEEALETFITVRWKRIVTQCAWNDLPPGMQESFMRLWDVLERNYITLLASAKAKSSTGTIMCDKRELVNTYEFVTETFTEKTLEAKYSRIITLFEGEEKTCVELWLALPRLKVDYKNLECNFANQTPGWYNTYDPEANVEAIPCDMQQFYDEELEIYKDVLFEGDEDALNYFLTWLAYAHQNMATKMPTTMFFQGTQGTGKSVLLKYIAMLPFGAFGDTQSGVKDSFSGFNAHMAGKKMMIIDEISDRLDFLHDGNLKHAISSETISIEFKGKDMINTPSYHQFIFASNEPDIVRLDRFDRRLSYFVTSIKYRQNIPFWLKQIAHFEDSNFAGKARYFFLNFKPEDFGCSFSDVMMPYQNNYREKLLYHEKNFVDTFFTMLMKKGFWDEAWRFETYDIALAYEEPTEVRTIDMLNVLGSYCAHQGIKFTRGLSLLQRAQQFAIDYFGDEFEKLIVENDNGDLVYVFPPRKEVLAVMLEKGVVGREEIVKGK